MAEPYDVFISYARADAEQVRRLAKSLHNTGLKVFFDEWEIGPGDLLVRKLDEGLNSKNGVLCVTPTALSRPWVLEEYAAMVTRAVDRKLQLIPVLLIDAELPPFLASRVWVDLRTADGPEYEREIQKLIAALKGEHPAPPPRQEGQILPRPGTAFRAEGLLRGRLRIGPESVIYSGENSEPVEHKPRGLSDRTRFRLWEMERARHRSEVEEAPLQRDASAATAQQPAFHGLLLEIGEALTREVLEGPAGEALRQEVQEAEKLGFPLELGLEAEDSLADLLWETLRLPGTSGIMGPPLALHPNIRLFRATPGLGPTPALPIPGPLRILVAIGSPEEQNARGELLDMERELSCILDAVEPARKQARPAYIRIIERGTVAAIREALQTERYHVLHVTSHAGPGVLVLEKEDGSEDKVDANRFCDQVLPPGRGVPLVVLAGCATALSVAGPQGDTQGEAALPGFARQLLARGVPAVLAMQAPVSDPYATELGERLYRALATFERPDPLAAVAEARRSLEADRQAGNLKARFDLAEWATPALYLRGPSLPLYDPEQPFEAIRPPAEPRFAPGIAVRRVGEFVGRRREERRILQYLGDPNDAGVLLQGLGGVGKSSLSAEILKNLAEEGWIIATTFGRILPDDLLDEVGQRLLGQFQKEGLSEADHRRRLAVEIKRPDVDWEDRFQALSQELLSERPLIILLDNFEDNFAPAALGESGADFHLGNEDLANLLASWLTAPGRSRFLITCRHPFELPQKAHKRLERLHLGPLSPAETRKLIWRLPALDALSREEQERAYANVGGHPRALEYLDALLRGGKARFPDVTLRIEDTLEKRGVRNPIAWLAKGKGDPDQALAEAITLAVDDMLLDGLIDRLKGVPLAEDLLIGASVYQVPVDLVGLAWQVSEEVEVPEDTERIQRMGGLQKTIEEILRRGEQPSSDLLKQWAASQRELLKPPLRVPDELGSAREVLLDLGLLAPVERSEEEASLYFVHRWTASGVLQWSTAERIQTAHGKAARYWRWRVDKIPQDKRQDIEDLLQVRHHYRQAGDTDTAVEVTERICVQIEVWGAYRREEQLCKEVLSWVPEHSKAAAAFSGQLGVIVQRRGDYDQALDWYKKALLIDEELGNRDGMAKSYHHLGVVAQNRGNYEQALDWYKKALPILEELGNLNGMASSYHQLGRVAQDQGDYEQALDWYKKSLLIREELGDRAGMSSSYHQLGMVAQERGDYEQALGWYEKSLLIKEELGDRAGMSTSYHQIGLVAQDQGDYEQALDWYKKSLLIAEQLGDQSGLAATIGQLAVFWLERGHPLESVPLTLRALFIHLKIGSPLVGIDLHWLNRQRELLGEKQFGEILREHLSEEDSQTVLELMDRTKVSNQAFNKAGPTGWEIPTQG